MRDKIIVTESQSDCFLLKTLLDPNNVHSEFRFFAAGGWSSADSLARSLLIKGDKDVALVVDADNENQAERRNFLRQSLGEIASSARWQVFVIAPQIDAILLTEKPLLENLIGKKIEDADFIRGQYDSHVLKQLFLGQSRLKLYQDKLPTLDLSFVRSLPIIQEIHSFLAESLQQAAA